MCFIFYGKSRYTFLHSRENWILRGPQSPTFWVPLNLSHHVVRQARTGDTLFVKSREMTGRTQTLPLAGGRRGKDDRKQDTLAPLLHILHYFCTYSGCLPSPPVSHCPISGYLSRKTTWSGQFYNLFHKTEADLMLKVPTCLKQSSILIWQGKEQRYYEGLFFVKDIKITDDDNH